MKSIIPILLILTFVSCSDNSDLKSIINTSQRTLSPGIINGKKVDQTIELQVILKDQYALQLFEGDEGQSKILLPLGGRGNDIVIKFEIDKITFTTTNFSAEHKYETSDIKLVSDFSGFSSGKHEILIAHKMVNNKEIPITIKLMDFPKKLKSKISSVESGLSKP